MEIDSTETFDSKKLIDTVWSAITKLYGEYGASQTGLTLINYDMTKRIVVIRVANASVDMVQAALASITKIDDIPAAVHVLKVSGTIRALDKKA